LTGAGYWDIVVLSAREQHTREIEMNEIIAAITSANFSSTVKVTPKGRKIVKVSVDSLDERIFDLLAAIMTVSGSYTVEPSGVKGITNVYAI
jgi:predicted component of type VI protein secretion system